MPSIEIIIFSKDRACQLEMLLTSMIQHLGHDQRVATHIIYKASTAAFSDAYLRLRSDHSWPRWLKEVDFRQQVTSLCNTTSPAVMFLVDDDVFLAPFSLDAPETRIFLQDTEAVCLSLRMHPGISFCHPKNLPTSPPPMCSGNRWHWQGLPGDWGYPMSLDGHVFRTRDIAPLVSRLPFRDPNSLEAVLAANPLPNPLMACFPKPRLVNIPYNRVQSYGTTRHLGISADELNNRFLLGDRLDRQAIVRCHSGIAPHEDIALLMTNAGQRAVRIIHHPHGESLGDLWATCNFLLRKSNFMKEPILLSRFGKGEIDLGQILTEILALLDGPGRVEVRDEMPTHRIDGHNVWKHPYNPTKVKWSWGPHHRIAVQFDGRSYAEQKNPPPVQLDRLRSNWLPGWELIDVGLPLTLAQSVEVLAASDAFIGVCSGISHVAHSVGTPSFLLEYGIPLQNSHSGNRYTRCGSADDAIAKVREFLEVANVRQLRTSE